MLFTSSNGWLWRFTKRFMIKIVIRRKPNTKREPIEKGVGKLKRWFAAKRLFLQSHKAKRRYCKTWSIYPRGNRWCLDQVPIGLFDLKTTYESKGVDHVRSTSRRMAQWMVTELALPKYFVATEQRCQISPDMANPRCAWPSAARVSEFRKKK